jgi:hypothetical protein
MEHLQMFAYHTKKLYRYDKFVPCYPIKEKPWKHFRQCNLIIMKKNSNIQARICGEFVMKSQKLL